MSNATAVAPVRATKAPPRAPKAPATAPAAQAGPETSPFTADEALVAATMGEQLTSICDSRWQDMTVYTTQLLELAIASLSEVGDGVDVFNSAAAAVYGALSTERADRPSSPVIPEMEQAFAALNSAALGYGFAEGECEALANGIRAGQRQFRDRPTPPIRRAGEPSQSQAGYRHSPRDIRAVFETMATQCEAVRDFSIDIRSRLQSESSSVVDACNDLTIVQHMVAFMGSMCDEMSGGAGTLIGGPAAWATMDGIAAMGGAT